MIVANVFHAGDGNLHPLVCYDGARRGRGRARRGAVGPDPRRLPGRRRLDHRRARRRRRQEEAHAEDVRRARPRRVPAAALRVRPRRARQPRQGHADAAAVRRGARPVPAATRWRPPAWRSGSDGDAPVRPSTRSPEEAAELLRTLGEAGAPCGPSAAARSRGAGAASRSRSSSRPAGWTAILEHNVGDFTAVLEAGVPLAEAQARVRRRRARCSRSTRRSAPATRRRSAGSSRPRDSGPLRHRYGGVRDLVVGITVVLSDGTIAKAGGKVIKNVAGYDLGKLFAGSFGTLGLIASRRGAPAPAARTAPRPRAARADDPDALARGRRRARRAAARGRLPRRRLARRRRAACSCASAARPPSARPARRRPAARRRARGRPDVEPTTTRSGRASARASARADGAVLKVSGRPTDLPAVLARRATPARGRRRRAPRSGCSWLALAGRRPRRRVAAVRAALAPRACTLHDVPDGAARVADPWPAPAPGALP